MSDKPMTPWNDTLMGRVETAMRPWTLTLGLRDGQALESACFNFCRSAVADARSEAFEEAAKVAEEHRGAARRDRLEKVKRLGIRHHCTDDTTADERGEDIASGLIATAIRARGKEGGGQTRSSPRRRKPRSAISGTRSSSCGMAGAGKGEDMTDIELQALSALVVGFATEADAANSQRKVIGASMAYDGFPSADALRCLEAELWRRGAIRVRGKEGGA